MRSLVLWLVLAAAIVAVLLLADAALAGSVKRRLEESISESMGQPATVELEGRPLVLRALTFGLPRVEITTSPAEGAAVRSLEATLSGVRVPIRGLVGGQRWTARGFEARVVPSAPFFGNEALQVEGVGLDGRTEGDISLVDLEVIEATGAGDGPTLQAEAEEIHLRLARDAGPEATVRRGRLAAADSTGSLPLAVADLLLAVSELDVTRDGGGTRMEAASLEVQGSGVPLGEDGAVMDRLEASLPEAVIERPSSDQGERPPIVITSSGGEFSATIEEAVIDELWRFPGTIALADERIQLTVGAVTLEAEATVEDGAIALQPVVPPLTRPFVGQLPTLLLQPPVPEGATLEAIVLRAGELEVTGTGERIVLR